ncbi:hypothetical protein AAG906_030632 [Vitis piasezkii]
MARGYKKRNEENGVVITVYVESSAIPSRYNRPIDAGKPKASTKYGNNRRAQLLAHAQRLRRAESIELERPRTKTRSKRKPKRLNPEVGMDAFFSKAPGILPSHFHEKGKGLRAYSNGNYQSQQKKEHNLEGFHLLQEINEDGKRMLWKGGKRIINTVMFRPQIQLELRWGIQSSDPFIVGCRCTLQDLLV